MSINCKRAYIQSVSVKVLLWLNNQKTQLNIFRLNDIKIYYYKILTLCMYFSVFVCRHKIINVTLEKWCIILIKSALF